MRRERCNVAEFGKTVSTADSLKKKIAAGKAIVKSKYSSCKRAAKRLVSSRNYLSESQLKKESKRTSRASARFAVAENRYTAALKSYKSCLSLYDELVDDVLRLYDELVMTENVKGAKKARVAAEKFDTQQSVLKEVLMMIVKDIDFDESNKNENNEDKNSVKEMIQAGETENKEDTAQPKVPPQQRQQTPPPPPKNSYANYVTPPYCFPSEYAYRSYQPQGINIAPVSIDISSIVENAVSAAMEKFKAALDKRIDDSNLGEGVSNTQVGTVPVISEKVAVMEENVAENEQYIIEKLASLTENLQKMSDEMTELSAAYMQLANKQKDAVELQRRINDMQRALSRELQGVQATQKVINQDQADVSAAQAELTEHQRANAENQKLICESQEGIAELEQSVIEKQSTIEQSMRDVLDSQKEIIAAQQAVMNANLKNVDLQRELAKKQSEVTNLQKTVISEYKQVTRAQKNIASKAKSRKPEEKEIAERQPVMTETLAEEANAIVAEIDASAEDLKSKTNGAASSKATDGEVAFEDTPENEAGKKAEYEDERPKAEQAESNEKSMLHEEGKFEDKNADDAFKA